MPRDEILIYGTIGESFWGEEAITASQVRRALAACQGDVTVRINSGGGAAADGMAIYSALVGYPGRVTVVVDGMASSAASLIAMAGDEIVMTAGSWMLIHDPAAPMTDGRGTQDDHELMASHLETIANGYAGIYAARAGLSVDEARAIMRAETLLSAEDAVAMGFATMVDPAKAAAAAAFDYRIYANAPADLRRASARYGRAPVHEAVMAMMAGSEDAAISNTSEGEAPMDARLTDAASEAAQTEEEAVAAVETEAVADPINDPEPAVTAASEPGLSAERARVSAILAASSAAGMGRDFIDRHIMAGTRAEAVAEAITQELMEVGMNSPMMGREAARVGQDERQTRRVAMADALSAQLARQAPEHPAARSYMTMSMVEMAAAAIGHRGSLRTADDRLGVIEMAMHSTSDFPGILENALNKRLQDSYTLAAPTYRDVAMRMDFADFRPHPVTRLSDFPMLQPVGEGGEIKFGSLSEKREAVSLESFASALSISRQVMVNDDLGAIDRMVMNSGQTVAAFEDQKFWSMALSGAASNGPTLTETTRQVFNTTDGTLAGTAAAITVASLSAGRAAMLKRKRLDGTDLAVQAAILLVGPDKLTEAEQLTASVIPAVSGSVNPFSGLLRVVVSSKIVGNAWYLFADPAQLPNFVYGFLQGQTGPRTRMDEPFGRQGVSFSVEHDFGCGAIDWRGGYKNAGA